MKNRKLTRPIFNIFIATVFIVIIIFVIKAFFKVSEDSVIERKTILLDEYTRIDSTLYSKDNITYYLTADFTNNSFDTLFIKEQLRQNLINDIRKNPDYSKWKQKKINFRYIYMNENGDKIFTEFIQYEMY